MLPDGDRCAFLARVGIDLEPADGQNAADLMATPSASSWSTEAGAIRLILYSTVSTELCTGKHVECDVAARATQEPPRAQELAP